MSISIVLLPTALLLKVMLFDKDYEQLYRQNPKTLKQICLPTNYNDKELLLKTLHQFRAQQVNVQGENVACRVGKYDMRFQKATDGYMVYLSKIQNPEELLQELRCLDGLYKQNLQEQVYCRTKQKIKEQGMQIQSEEVMEDNSVVITVSV